MVYIRDLIAKYVLDDTISGKPEGRAVLAAEAAAAQQKEDDMVKQRGRVGDITIVGPKSVDLKAIIQEIGALPADLEEQLGREKEREDGEIGEHDEKEEEYDPLRPQLSRAAARGREKIPPWRERKVVFVEDPGLRAKVFGHMVPTRACRECLLRPVDQKGRFDRRGRCEYHRSRDWEKTSISLCDHKWLMLYWTLDDPSNLQGGWQLIAVGERDQRVEVEKKCERCENEKLPESRCEELARRVVDHAKVKLKWYKEEFERVEMRCGQLAKRGAGRHERFKKEEEMNIGPLRGDVKVVVPNLAFAEREIRVLLLALKGQESNERERQQKKQQKKVEQMLKNLKEMRPENMLQKPTQKQEVVASAEEHILESVESLLVESVQTADYEGEVQHMPPAPPRNTEDIPAITPPPETEETVLKYQIATESGDPPATTDSIVANRGSPVPTLEPEVADTALATPTLEEVSAILSSLTSTVPESEAKEEHLEAEAIGGIPAAEEAGAVLTTATLEALQNEILHEKVETEATLEDTLTLPAPEEVGAIPSTPKPATPEPEDEGQKVDAEVTSISDMGEASPKGTSPPSPSVQSPEVAVEIQANEVVAASVEQASETVASISPSLHPLLSPILSNPDSPSPTHPTRSPSPPLLPPRKRSRTASLPLASLPIIKRPRLSLPTIPDPSNQPTNPSTLSPPTTTKARRDSILLYITRKRIRTASMTEAPATRRRSSASSSSPSPPARRKRSRTASVSDAAPSSIAAVKSARGGSGDSQSSLSSIPSDMSGTQRSSASSSESDSGAEIITQLRAGGVDEKAAVGGRKAVQFRKRKSYIEDEVDFNDGEVDALVGSGG
ncbi:uncharacterized protein BDZ99DRAFT_570224 [Mytilinidion resinicola]|uniref:Uncharacterized protein n=1 Tax=Mytilinidion resinicola TaxID=574789 RepID=A0A6A6YPW2_9PEZI|nr:uncharacterized protein BDZ99DRAFT_570224 [Mytilinidion resinicola]KAF2810936.1 hypothetical protein BDZ99DRAFT_570224 [Mytilinidion resinicola]